jgi:hypothetical protein
MRTLEIALATLFTILVHLPFGSGEVGPPMPTEVTVIMDSTEASVVPTEGGPFIFPQHGIVVWNTTSVPVSILEVRVELLTIGLGLQNSIRPLPIILSRADNEFDFELFVIIPPGFPAHDIEYTIEGYYEHTAHQADRRALDPIPMVLHIEPYSMVAFRELGDGDQAEIGKQVWETIDISIWNQGNAEDVYTPSIECLGNAEVRYDNTPIPIGADGFKRFSFEVFARTSEPAIIVVRMGTQHELVNCTGEIRFTLYVDSTSNYLGRNGLVFAGIGALIILLALLLVLSVHLLRKRARSRRIPRGHG